MDTMQIIAACRTLPGVRVESSDACTTLFLQSESGEGSMRFFPLFPGLTLAWIQVNASLWPAPQPGSCAPDAKGPLLINYCTKGRCELILNDRRHVFLTAGEISLTERFAQKDYLYPGGVYEGFEVFIDPDTVEAGQPLLRDWFGVDLSQLRRRCCPDGETFLAKYKLPENLLARLGAQDSPDDAALCRMKTGLIDLLFLLTSTGFTPQAAQPVYYTKTQVEIAKRTEALITADLSQAHTVREFSELFSVSESSVKNYFFGVFGQSISQYTTHRRMQRAAELLAQTRLSVVEIANQVGYMNQSKFSAAFRRAYASTPLEYRREHAIRSLHT